MKKSTLFLACCIGLMLLASCKKDPIAPTISVFNGEGYATENTQIYSGDQITVGFVATGEKLTQIEVILSQNGTTLTQHSESIEKLGSYNYSHTFTVDATGAVTVTGRITDESGLTANTSFNVICNEKPNEKFIGHYEGDALLTGSYNIELSNMEPTQENFTNRPVPVIVDINAGEHMNEIIGTCKVDDQIYTAIGTIEGNTATFEAVDEVFNLDFDFNGTALHPQITVNYTINTTISDNQLILDGVLEGSGDITILFFNGSIALNDTIGGSLNKIR